MDNGLRKFVSISWQLNRKEQLRWFRITVVWLSNFNWEDHNIYEVIGVGLENPVKKPMPVDFRTTPVFVTFLHGDLFRNIPVSNMLAPFQHHIANTIHSPLPMHSSVYKWWLSMLLRILLSEARQVVVCIPVVRIASSLRELSRGLI